MQESIFSVPRMDCPSEEALIRSKLDELPGIHRLVFDLESRRVKVYHSGPVNDVAAAMGELGLGATLTQSSEMEGPAGSEEDLQRRSLYIVLGINFAFFLAEMTAGLISRSMSLVADSLDMFADASVYGLSIWAVGRAAGAKRTIARTSGLLQIALAVIGFGEVLRRFIGMQNPPEFRTMIDVSALAMLANISCLFILLRVRIHEAHMRASMIFTSNDVIINAGVIVAGILVFLLESNKPDLVVGAIVFLIVMQGAYRILRLGR